MSLIQVTLLLILLYNFFLCFSGMPGPFMLRKLKTYKSSPSKMKLRHPASWTQKRETTSKPSLVHIFFFFFSFFFSFFFHLFSLLHIHIHNIYITNKEYEAFKSWCSFHSNISQTYLSRQKKNKII